MSADFSDYVCCLCNKNYYHSLGSHGGAKVTVDDYYVQREARFCFTCCPSLELATPRDIVVQQQQMEPLVQLMEDTLSRLRAQLHAS